MLKPYDGRIIRILIISSVPTCSCSHAAMCILVGEPKSRIVQKHIFFAPERYTAGILNTYSLNSA